MKLRKVLVLVLSLILALSVFSGCNKKKKYDNEKDAFVMSISELDGVFNPFFSTSGVDGEVIGLTQLSMLTTDSKGNVAYGDEWNSVVRDYTEDPHGKENAQDKNDFSDYYTTYQFLLKNNIKFSDGSDLTWKDVLFNFYVYLDPSYTGSTTMYSTNIKGLTEYRTQTESREAALAKEADFAREGNQRVTKILNDAAAKSLDKDNITGDIKIITDRFMEELNSDWNYAAASLEEYQKDVPAIDTVWKAFFVYEEYIQIERKDGVKSVKEWGGLQNFITGDMTDEQIKNKCIDYVYKAEIKPVDNEDFNNNIAYILSYRSSGTAAYEYFKADQKSKYFDLVREQNDGKLASPNVTGISVKHNVTNFNSKALGEGHDVLEIVVNGVDPKAIYNFGVPITPMKYYGGEYAKNNFNGTDNFGVDFGSIDFMYDVVRKQDVPVGAGPYKVTDIDNNTSGVAKNRFFSNNVVYYMRNDYFLLGSPKIKYVRYKVITKTQLMDSTVLGEVHYSDPDAKSSNYTKISNNSSFLSYKDPMNLGYGYIGINAKYVPDINVRRAIMSAMDTSLALQYYTNGSAVIINRSMSLESWAYPEGVTAYYPYDETGKKSEDYIKNDYSRANGTGTLTNTAGHKLKYTFTIAGSTDEHPMYNTLVNAARILNSKGFDITVSTDPNALRKLASGTLAVWAAAWSSTIDPDMYQVYHKDSSATSVLNWGFKDILDNVNGGIYTHRTTEAQWINELAVTIEDARKTTDKAERAPLYHKAMNQVMELAVELPTYQRKNLFVYNKSVIDESTMTPESEISAYSTPVQKIWQLSLVTK